MQLLSAIGKMLYYAAGPILFPLVLRNSTRTRVLVIDGRGSVVLVKSLFSSQHWNLPGGGVRRKESAVSAACRELREETGLALDESSLQSLGESERYGDYFSTYTIEYFSVQVPKQQVLSRNWYEIIDAEWFSVEDLKDLDLHSNALTALSRYNQ